MWGWGGGVKTYNMNLISEYFFKILFLFVCFVFYGDSHIGVTCSEWKREREALLGCQRELKRGE